MTRIMNTAAPQQPPVPDPEEKPEDPPVYEEQVVVTATRIRSGRSK